MVLQCYHIHVGGALDIPTDFGMAALNDVSFSSTLININQGFVAFTGSVSLFIVPITLSPCRIIPA